MNDKELHQHCIDWVQWCRSRRYYLAPGAKNILARLQPSKSGEVPDARNHPDMQYFNMAVHMLADMPEHAETFACFALCHIEQRRNIKREAERLKICRRTYYNRVSAFARKAYSMAQSLKAMQAKMPVGGAERAECVVD